MSGAIPSSTRRSAYGPLQRSRLEGCERGAAHCIRACASTTFSRAALRAGVRSALEAARSVWRRAAGAPPNSTARLPRSATRGARASKLAGRHVGAEADASSASRRICCREAGVGRRARARQLIDENRARSARRAGGLQNRAAQGVVVVGGAGGRIRRGEAPPVVAEGHASPRARGYRTEGVGGTDMTAANAAKGEGRGARADKRRSSAQRSTASAATVSRHNRVTTTHARPARGCNQSHCCGRP